MEQWNRQHMWADSRKKATTPGVHLPQRVFQPARCPTPKSASLRESGPDAVRRSRTGVETRWRFAWKRVIRLPNLVLGATYMALGPTHRSRGGPTVSAWLPWLAQPSRTYEERYGFHDLTRSRWFNRIHTQAIPRVALYKEASDLSRIRMNFSILCNPDLRDTCALCSWTSKDY